MAGKKGGLIFGIMMGTLLGVLFAPRKGKDLREKLVKEIKDGGLGTKTLGDNLKGMGQDMAGTAQDVYEMPQVRDNLKKGEKSIRNLCADIWKNIISGFSKKKSSKDE